MGKLTGWTKFCLVSFPISLFGIWLGIMIESQLIFGGYMFILGWAFTTIIYELRISKHLPLKTFANVATGEGGKK